MPNCAPVSGVALQIAMISDGIFYVASWNLSTWALFLVAFCDTLTVQSSLAISVGLVSSLEWSCPPLIYLTYIMPSPRCPVSCHCCFLFPSVGPTRQVSESSNSFVMKEMLLSCCLFHSHQVVEQKQPSDYCPILEKVCTSSAFELENY